MTAPIPLPPAPPSPPGPADRTRTAGDVATLPPELRVWASVLGFLDDDVVTGLGPLVRRLDQLMAGSDRSSFERSAAEGYDGFDTRGPLGRLVLSEWALAAEAPEEFERRFAEHELLYLRPAAALPHRPTRLAVLVDAGPEQLGAPRLVQLAALVVLARRAAARGVPFSIGVLGDAPDVWSTGVLADVFPDWLAARRPTRPTVDDVVGRLADAEPDDQWWLLCGPDLAHAVDAGAPTSPRVRVLSASIDEWEPDGASAVVARIDHRVARLELPSPAVAVRLLRGRALRRPNGPAAATTAPSSLRFPSFLGVDRYLLGRGPTDRDLVRVPVGSHGSGRTRSLRFGGPVVAAMSQSSRTVALVVLDGALCCRIVGKGLAGVQRIVVPIEALELDDHDVDRLADGPVAPLYFQSGTDTGTLLTRLDGRWWHLNGSDAHGSSLATVGPGASTDQPRCVWGWSSDGRVRTTTRTLDVVAVDVDDAPPVLVGPGHIAVRSGPTEWRIVQDGVDVDPAWTATLAVEAGARALGLVIDGADSGPRLVTLSPGGHVLRSVGAESTRTLTSLSGDIVHAAVHPTRPLVLVQHEDESVHVLDLGDDTTVLTFRPEAST